MPEGTHRRRYVVVIVDPGRCEIFTYGPTTANDDDLANIAARARAEKQCIVEIVELEPLSECPGTRRPLDATT